MVHNVTKFKAPALRYEEVAQQLRGQIKAKTLLPGDRLPSLRALRREFGVTQATIDKAYSILEGEGLIVRSQRSGIFVAPPEQRASTGLIGFCSISFFKQNYTPFWAHLIEGVESAANDAKTPLLLFPAEAELGWQKIDGALLNGFGDRVPARFIPPDIPLVSLFALPTLTGSVKERERVLEQTTLVAFDDYGGMRSATEHLIALGHRRIAFLNNSQSDKMVFPKRLAGYRDALIVAGIEPQDKWLHALEEPTPQLYFMNAARETMRRWIQSDFLQTGCTALVTQNDDTACGAIQALRDAGIRVPEDISVVGFDGTQNAELCDPPLTTVELPLQSLGRAGVETLMQLIARRDLAGTTIMLPTQLRVRASSTTAKAPG